MRKLIVVRHGQSQWNLENRFTGWYDVDLTEQGRQEAAAGAQRLIEADLLPDVSYTSYLKRAIRTLWIVLDRLDRMWIDTHRSWRLNERHYGVLQGLNKAEIAQKYGDEQVHIWRRSYDTPPKALSMDDEMHPINDTRYKDVESKLLPATESLKHVLDRMLPLWKKGISQQIEQDKQVLIAAHGNSLRALTMYLTGMNENEIMDFNIPTGTPLVFTMKDKNTAKDMYFLDKTNN